MIEIFSTPIKIFTNSLQKSMKNWKRLEIGSRQTSYLLIIKKTKYTLFHKNSIKDYLPLKLPDLKIANNQIERKKAIKFLGVMLDENVNGRNIYVQLKTK